MVSQVKKSFHSQIPVLLPPQLLEYTKFSLHGFSYLVLYLIVRETVKPGYYLLGQLITALESVPIDLVLYQFMEAETKRVMRNVETSVTSKN